MVQIKNVQAVTTAAMTPVIRAGRVNPVDWDMCPPPMKWREHNALCHRTSACDSAVIIEINQPPSRLSVPFYTRIRTHAFGHVPQAPCSEQYRPDELAEPEVANAPLLLRYQER